MLEPQNNYEHPLIKFGKSLRFALRTNNIKQSEFAREFARVANISVKSSLQIVNQMLQGESYRLTDKNVLLFFQVLAVLDAFTEDTVEDNLTVLENWYEDFCEAKGIDYIPLKDNKFEGKLIIQIIKDKQAIREQTSLLDRQLALDRPRYYTKWGTELIGRHKDIEAIFTMLQESTQFLTLGGIPGVGKTELALQIENLAQQRGYINVTFLSLEQVKCSDEMQRMINNYLQKIDTKQLTLLILDNCDDIKDMEKARREVYSLVRKNAHLFILSTSRIAFSSTRDEHKVKPLDVPGNTEEALTSLLEKDTVRLFLEEVKPIVTLNECNAEDIASLCRAVGGLPQAVKIAAPLVRLKGEEEIRNLLKLIENRTFLQIKNLLSDNPRQQTLYALIGVSYYRLGEDGQTLEQKILRRLGIFEGGCSIASLLAVYNLEGDLPTSEDDPDLINALNTLASHNLIIFEKHQLITLAHSTIGDFALEIMEKTEREAIRKRFMNYYTKIALDYNEELLKEIKEQNKIEKYLTIFENEKGNLLVALLAHAKLGSGSLAYEKLREYYGLIE